MRKNLGRIRATASATRILTGLALTLCLTALAHAGDPPAPTVKAGEIIVQVAPAVSADSVRQMADAANCDYVKAVPYCPGFFVVRLKKYADPAARPVQPEPVDSDTQTAITSLKKTAGVMSADPNYIEKATWIPQPLIPLRNRQTGAPKTGALTRATATPAPSPITPNDTLYGKQWGLTMIRMPEAWSIQSGQQSVVVGVADTGIDVGHPDFATADGTGTRIVGGQNFAPDTTDPNAFQDIEGHGTHVAGTIGATTNNSLGVASVAGWNAGGVDVKIRAARVLAPGGGTADSVASGINYLVSQNVDVINLSLGSPGTAAVMQTAVANAIAKNVVVVAALGNSSLDTGLFPFYPAAYPGVIAVSSINIDKKLASYSNFGGNVAIAAPGGDFFDANINQFDQQIWSTWPRNVASDAGVVGYNAISGTSMASPHVAGAVALLLANGAPHIPATVKNILQTSAQVLPDDTPNFSGGNRYGAGLLDVYSAILPYADPAFQIGFVGDVDLGTTYSSLFRGFILHTLGVLHAPPVGAVTIEIQPATIPVSIVRTLVEGTDFIIPRTVPAGQPKATVFTVVAPTNGGASLNLAPGRYKGVLKVSGTVVGTQFFEIIAKTQPQGRALFSTPFQIRAVNSAQPEQALFGPDANFTLARYNPLRLPSDFDYAIFSSSSTGRHDLAASFSATAPDGTPLVYDINDPTTSVAPVGLGYWLNLDRTVTLNTVGPVVTNSVGIRLFAGNGGWNLVGAPFVQSTAWGSVSVKLANGTIYNLNDAVANNIISSALIGYRNGDYVYNVAPNGTLDPFNGYWVRVYQDCTLLVAPSNVSRAVAPLVPAKTAVTVDNSGWRARLMATVGGDRDGQNYFGQSASAKDENDVLDIPKPPSGAGHAYVRFITPAGNGRSVSNAFDIRSLNTKGKVEWSASVSTDRAGGDVTLTWDGIGNAPHHGTLTLTDSTTGQKVDMRSRSAYTFKAGEAGTSRMFTITLAPGLSSGPLAITNVAVVGGRSAVQPGVAVRFNVTAESQITGEIKSLSGVKVGNLTGVSRAVAGDIATLRWDGRSRSGAAVPPGPYLLEITARSADGQTATFKQPVQIMQ